MNRLITTFDEVPPLSTEIDLLPAIHIAGNDGVSLKTCTAEVFRPLSELKSRSSSVSERRKDSAVHVSLSSSSLVKQPGTVEAPTFQRGRVPTPLPTMDELQSTYVDCCVTQQGEEHQWRVRSPWSVTRRRRAQWSGYRPPRPGLSTPIVNKSSHSGLSKIIE